MPDTPKPDTPRRNVKESGPPVRKVPMPDKAKTDERIRQDPGLLQRAGKDPVSERR